MFRDIAEKRWRRQLNVLFSHRRRFGGKSDKLMAFNRIIRELRRPAVRQS